MSAYLYEFEEENKRRFNKILIFLLAIAAGLGGIVIYFSYSDFSTDQLSVTEITCDVIEKESYNIQVVGSGFDSIARSIEIHKGYHEFALIYKTLSNNEQCEGGTGLWFEYPQGRERYVYCLDPLLNDKVVEFKIDTCRKIDDLDSIERSTDSFFEAFGQKE